MSTMETPDGDFVGKMVGLDVTRDDLQEFFNATSVRVVYPGSMYDQDYDAKRLKVIVDDTHVIQEITWG